jgi:lysozyme
MLRRAFLQHAVSPFLTETSMQASEECIAAIKRFEGFRAKAYLDAVQVWTIGYGETHNVKPSDVWTEHQADLALRAECAELAHELSLIVKVPLNQGQFDALISWTFNLGCSKLLTSTLLGALNSHDFAFAARQFPRWCYAEGRVLPGLKARRLEEQRWFETGVCSSLPLAA